MRAAFLRKIPWLSLALFLLTFSLIGSFLSAYSPIWSFWSLITVLLLTVLIIWFGDDILRWVGVGSQGLFVVSGLTIVACLAVLASGVFAQVVMLLAAEFLARVEMKSAGFNRNHTLLVLATIAALGLGLGWTTGTLLFHSESFYEVPAQVPHNEGSHEVPAQVPHNEGSHEVPAKVPHNEGSREVPAH